MLLLLTRRQDLVGQERWWLHVDAFSEESWIHPVTEGLAQLSVTNLALGAALTFDHAAAATDAPPIVLLLR